MTENDGATEVIVSQPSNQFRTNNNKGNTELIVIWTLFITQLRSGAFERVPIHFACTNLFSPGKRSGKSGHIRGRGVEGERRQQHVDLSLECLSQ